MSLRIRVDIQGVNYFLDLYQDEPVNLNVSFAEIEDITKKNSAFSQSFRLPGTKNNNTIFNYYYDLNATPLNFNPNNKFDAILSWDGTEILQGNIRLNKVTQVQDEIIYDITFYNQVGNLSANIGDKFLRNLDYSSLSHPYTPNVVLESQLDPTLFPLTGSTGYSYQDGRTFWGLYNIGYSYISGNSVDVQVSPLVNFSPFTGTSWTPIYGYYDFSGTPVNDFYYKPTLQIKWLYEKICEEAGYEVTSEFFDTDYFGKYYLPLKFLDETIYSRGATFPCYAFNSQTLNFTSATPSTITVNPSTGITCNVLNFTSTTTSFNVPTIYQGTYTARISYLIVPNFTGCSIDAVNQSCATDFTFSYYDPSGIIRTYTIPAVDCFLSFNIPGCCPFNPIGTGSAVESTRGQAILSLNAITLRTDAACGGPQLVSFDVEIDTNIIPNISLIFNASDVQIQNFSFEFINGPRFLLSGTTIDYGLEFPENDYKQIDFITSINRYFNLVVTPNPDKPTQLIVEPIVDYIGKGQVLDWTTKIDHLQPIDIYPTTSLVNGTLEYEFKLDQDYANENYKRASNRIFGTEKKKLGLEYKDSVTKFEFMFSSPLDITNGSAVQSVTTLSSFSKLNTKDEGGVSIQTFLPFKILPRLLFRGITLPVDNYGYVGTSGTTPYQLYYLKSVGQTNTQDRFQEINRFTTYPFNYSGFSHYINWRGEDVTTITPPEFEFPLAEDLYDIYYKDYIEDLISDENKIYQAKAYLYPNEIKALRFDEKIIVDNTYFRINKISNFNLLEPSICDIELVKLTRTYEGHRIKYYDLYPCASGGTIYHSNSDLMYNLYAYIGNYVTLFDNSLNYLGCYSVSAGTYNSAYTYQHFYISSAYTPNLVAVYSDCGCSGRTAFDVYQEPLPSPSPSPTPSVTPSLTPSMTPTQTPGLSPSPTRTPTLTPTPSKTPGLPSCDCYEVINNGPGDLIVNYYRCDGVFNSYTIPAVDVGLIFKFCATSISLVGNGTTNNTGACVGGVCP